MSGRAEGLIVAAHTFFRAAMSDAPTELDDYLIKRGFTMADAAKFSLGYTGRDGTALREHLEGFGYRSRDAEDVGLGRQPLDQSELLRNRLVWPIRSLDGTVVGFAGRRLSLEGQASPKYVTTARSSHFDPTRALYVAQRGPASSVGATGRVVLVEGYSDVMACHLAGISNAVTTCGRPFGAVHARQLGARGTSELQITVMFDGDAAGQAAARRLKEAPSSSGFRLTGYVALPEGHDPASYRAAYGDAQLRARVAEAMT